MNKCTGGLVEGWGVWWGFGVVGGDFFFGWGGWEGGIIINNCRLKTGYYFRIAMLYTLINI